MFARRALGSALCVSLAGCGLWEYRGADGKTALYEAIEAKDLAEIKRLVDERADVNAWNLYREDALPLVRVLQGEGASQGLRPLHAAARLGQAEVARYLIRQGARVDVRNHLGQTPLWFAASRDAGDVRVAEILIENGAGIDVPDRKGITPLMQAARNGHTELVTFLARHGADVNQQAEGGRSALHEAAERGQAEMARTLLEMGANVDASLDTGQRPLELAVLQGHSEVVGVLLASGADPNLRAEGTSPLLIGTAFRGQVELVELLLEHGARTDETSDGWTALHHAADNDQGTVIPALVHCGGDPERVEPDGHRTPLQLAVFAGNVSAVRGLLDAGADPDGGMPPVSPPLAQAARDGHLEIVRLLVEYGADVNRRVNDWTPLRMAEFGNHRGIVDYLKQQGAEY